MARVGAIELLIILVILLSVLGAVFALGFFVGYMRGRTVGARDAERLVRGGGQGP
jgi:hypothetical protein